MRSTAWTTPPAPHSTRAPGLEIDTDWVGIETALQPIRNLASGTVLGYEALLRPLDRCCRRWLPPPMVLTHPQSTNAARELEWLQAHLARAVEVLPASGRLFLNVEPATLVSQARVFLATSFLITWGWSPSQVVLEVTEPGRSDISAAEWTETKEVLKERRFWLAVDDWDPLQEGWRVLDALQPHFVKIGLATLQALDRKTPSGVDARRSLQGLGRREVGCIVEGIENEAAFNGRPRRGRPVGSGVGPGTAATNLRTPEPEASVNGGRNVSCKPSGPLNTSDPRRGTFNPSALEEGHCHRPWHLLTHTTFSSWVLSPPP